MIGDLSQSLKMESFSHLRSSANQTQYSHHHIVILMIIIRKAWMKKLEVLHKEDLLYIQRESENTHSTRFKSISKTLKLTSNLINSFKEEHSKTLLMKFQSSRGKVLQLATLWELSRETTILSLTNILTT